MGLYFEVPKPTHTFRNPTPSWSESEGLEEPRKRAVAEPNVAEKKAAMAGGNRSSFLLPHFHFIVFIVFRTRLLL